MTLQRYVLIGVRWNGNEAKLYQSNILLLTQLARERRINPRKWRYLIIPQGLVCPRPLDTKMEMWKTGETEKISPAEMRYRHNNRYKQQY